MAEIKQCPRCGKIKKKSQFRYIKYYDAHRRICKMCESIEKRKKKKVTEDHVVEHCVTPKVMENVNAEVTERAVDESQRAILGNLPSSARYTYKALLWVNAICGILSIPVIVSTLYNLYQGLYRNSAILVSISLGVVTIVYALNRIHVEPIESEVRELTRSTRQNLFDQTIKARLEYDKFYSSPEWVLLRKKFLKSQEQVNGRFICFYCNVSISPNSSDLTIDHIKPRSKYPELAVDISNLRVACRRCNSSKGAKILN
jgi:5-methylcytosine-specific restriction endonuclease McrA